MALPVAVVHRRSWSVVVVEAATIVVALAAAASTWLPLVDRDLLESCGCDARFRLAEACLWLPTLAVALVGGLQFGGGAGRARSRMPAWVSTAVSALALVTAMLATTVVQRLAVKGVEQRVVVGVHVALVVLLVVRRLVRGDADPVVPAVSGRASAPT